MTLDGKPTAEWRGDIRHIGKLIRQRRHLLQGANTGDCDQIVNGLPFETLLSPGALFARYPQGSYYGRLVEGQDYRTSKGSICRASEVVRLKSN